MIQNIYPRSGILIFLPIQDPGSGSATLSVERVCVLRRQLFLPSSSSWLSDYPCNWINWSILTQQIVSKLSEIWSKIFIPNGILIFHPSRIRIRNSVMWRGKWLRRQLFLPSSSSWLSERVRVVTLGGTNSEKDLKQEHHNTNIVKGG